MSLPGNENGNEATYWKLAADTDSSPRSIPSRTVAMSSGHRLRSQVSWIGDNMNDFIAKPRREGRRLKLQESKEVSVCGDGGWDML